MHPCPSAESTRRMSSIPRILVLDDQYGNAQVGGRNRVREDLCLNVGLQDVTGDVLADPTENPIAEAVFCSGQVCENGTIHNALEGTLEFIRQGWTSWPRWTLLLLDMQFKTGRVNTNGKKEDRWENDHPDSYFGLEILERLWEDPELRDIPVVILSAMQRKQIEQRFARHGVFDFVDKTDLTRDRLGQLLQDHGLLVDENIVGHSVLLLKSLRAARRRARLGNTNILLLGETGTGKELFARYIHQHSGRNGQYVPCFTQGVPETLVDDRLFGHAKGAFHGADHEQQGAAELADGGTLFIDEFGDIEPAVQGKLMRLLQEDTRETQRLGENRTRKVDLLVVLATNRLDILDTNDFRSDLLHRANITNLITLPPLRQRQDDIELLAKYFVASYEETFSASLKTEHREISPEAMDALVRHPWPGNVNQLKQVIAHAVSSYPRLRVLSASHLTLPVSKPEQTQVTVVPPPDSQDETDLQTLLRKLKAVGFNTEPQSRSDWAGALPKLQAAYSCCLGALLKASLQVTSQVTVDHPEGAVRIHPAGKLLSGDARLTASKAADIIKRILSFDNSSQQKLLSDPLLKEAYKIAIRLRPKSTRKARS
jgi:DNA-binding NtrC family response regulator